MDWGFRKEYTNKIWMLLFLTCASFHIGWVGIWVVPWVGLWYGMKKRWGGVKNLLLTQLWLCTVVTDILSWQEGTYKWRIVLTVDNWFVIALFHWIPDSWTDWHTCYTRSEITCLRMHLNGSSIFPSWYVNLCQLPSWLFFPARSDYCSIVCNNWCGLCLALCHPPFFMFIALPLLLNSTAQHYPLSWDQAPVPISS